MLIVSGLEHGVVSYFDLAQRASVVGVVTLLISRVGTKSSAEGDDVSVMMI